LTLKKQRRRLVGKCIDCYTKEIERCFKKTPSFGHEILKKQIEEKKNTKTTPKSGKGKKKCHHFVLGSLPCRKPLRILESQPPPTSPGPSLGAAKLCSKVKVSG